MDKADGVREITRESIGGELMDLSVIIPARNEEFIQQTVDNVLEMATGDTEVIVILDGYWPEPGLADHPKVTIIHHEQPIGQRAATNEGVKLSQAKYIMKLDAHCSMDKGFDVKLMADCEPDWTVVPRMYNLHAFDWECKGCGHRTYQGALPARCDNCDSDKGFKKKIVWKEKTNPASDFMRFNQDLKFQYWREYKTRDEAKSDIADQMCAIGACYFMHRDRYWDIGGLDEGHGSWGQMGVEIACKSWLSGGKQVVNKKTWFAHMFRTGNGFGFPYSNPGIRKARAHSQDLWKNNNWDKAIHPLSWLIEKFAPVPDWEVVKKSNKPTKGIVYYTDNRCEERILQIVRKQIKASCNGHKLVSVSQYPIDFGENFVMPLERSNLTMFKQMLKGLEEIDTDIVYFCEHDVIYHPSHFDFVPTDPDKYYYNQNIWKLDSKSGRALFYMAQQTSCLCGYRSLLLEHYRKRVEICEDVGFTRRMGYEPGTHGRKEKVDSYKAERYFSKHPNIDLRHRSNITSNRFKKSQFRREPKEWQVADSIPFWGHTKGRFDEFIRGIDVV